MGLHLLQPAGDYVRQCIADENRKPEAVICQGFDAETVVGGRPVFISLLESIAADDGKGDLTGNISFDVDDGSTPARLCAFLRGEVQQAGCTGSSR